MKQHTNFKDNKKKERKNLAIMFGGRSSEHEISIITALQAITAIDTTKYNVIPLYIHPDGKWFTGQPLLDKSFYRSFNQAKVQRVTLLPEPNIGGLFPIEQGKIKADQLIPIDLYFLAFHGQYGEDGSIQGLLELANATYTGCGVTAAAITMNKYLCKKLLEAHNIPVLPSIIIKRSMAQSNWDMMLKTIEETFGAKGYPLFIKPSHLGSSIGISKAENLAELLGGLAKVFKYDDEAIIEPCIINPQEINVAVLEGNPPVASVVEIPLSSTGTALTYEDKYLRGGKKTARPSSGMASLTRKIDPPELDANMKREVVEYALKAYDLLGCRGVSRLDFMVDQKNGNLYFNELNSLPGSLAFYLWEKSSPRLLYTEVIERMLQHAQLRRGEQLSLQRDVGFKALSP